MTSPWPTRVVVGVDTSPESLAALDRGLALAERAHATVIVVHAVGLLEEAALRPRPDVDRIIAAACARTGCPSDLVEPPVIEDGPAINVLVRVAERVGGDLVVVGRRGTGESASRLGSTSAGVLDEATVPVLVVSL